MSAGDYARYRTTAITGLLRSPTALGITLFPLMDAICQFTDELNPMSVTANFNGWGACTFSYKAVVLVLHGILEVILESMK